jgi:hypothetical protein
MAENPTPPKSRQQIRQDADIRILRFLIEAEGLSRTIRFLQYAIEAQAAEIAKPQAGGHTDAAITLLKASDELESIYEKFKNEFKL